MPVTRMYQRIRSCTVAVHRQLVQESTSFSRRTVTRKKEMERENRNELMCPYRSMPTSPALYIKNKKIRIKKYAPEHIQMLHRFRHQNQSSCLRTMTHTIQSQRKSSRHYFGTFHQTLPHTISLHPRQFQYQVPLALLSCLCNLRSLRHTYLIQSKIYSLQGSSDMLIWKLPSIGCGVCTPHLHSIDIRQHMFFDCLVLGKQNVPSEVRCSPHWHQ